MKMSMRKGKGKGKKVSDEDFAAIMIRGDDFHPEWNYSINPSFRK
jgi:hypothetical protein